MCRRHKSACWFNIASLFAGLAAFEVYRSLSFADAEYRGETFLYYFSVIAPLIICAVIAWEFACIVDLRRWKSIGACILNTLKKGIYFFRTCSIKCRLFILSVGFAIISLAGVALYVWINECSTEYYEAVMEFYGIPEGVGEPLSPEERENRAGYWRIDDYPQKHRMTLTYVDAYGQLELMRQYSSAYAMSFFQPPARVEYHYRKNEDKFRSYGRECYDCAKKHGFREPVEVTYYASNGKVLLELSGDGYEKLGIDAYSSEDIPQLLYSTLLRVPDGQTAENGVDAWQIENSYDIDGIPVMRRLSAGVCNLYGVNGERYTYDSDKRLESICYLDVNGIPACNKQGIMLISFQYKENGNCEISYYSDESGAERTEGFYGVYCEELKYNSDGNVAERWQRDKQGRWCCDVNGVYKYTYEYDEHERGRLKSEAYEGVDEQPVRSSQVDSRSVSFSLERTEDAEIIKVFLDYEEAFPEFPEPLETALFQSRYLTGAVFHKSSGTAADEKNVRAELSEPQAQNAASANESGNLSYDREERENNQKSGQENGQERKRNYASIQNTITKDSLEVKYLDKNGSNIMNESGYAIRRVLYDEKMRVTEESYLGLDEEPCLIDDGYAAIRTTYRPAADDKIERIEYLDTGGELAMNKKEGYASVLFQYGRQGESDVVTSYYLDSKKEPVYLPNLGYAAVDRLYNKNGFLIQETYRDKDGIITCRNDYMVAEILYEYADDGNLIRIWYKDANEKPTNRHDTGYAVIYQEFEAGQLVRRHYEGYRNRILCAVPDKTTGICDTVYYYTKGRKQQVQYFDTEGRPALRSDMGCAAIDYEYDNNGNILCWRYYGVDGKLILRKDTGYAVKKCEYNEEEQYKLYRYLDVNEQPIVNQEYHCAGTKEIYDGDKLVEIQYLDLDGSLLNRSDYGFARVCKTYGNAGNLESEAYFDADGTHAVRKEYGYAMFENIYEDGKLKECRYYDFPEGQKELVMRRDTGYAIVRYGYDDNGNQNSQTYFDTEGQPVISTKYHCAGILSEYDDYGNETETQYIDTDADKKLLNRDDYGFAQVCRKYDQKTGKLLGESYFDTEGLPVVRKGSDYASYEQRYDERGNWVETRYYNAEGELTLREDMGYAIIRNEYNEYDEQSAQYFYGTEEKPIISTEYHCAGFVYTYDKKERQTQISYVGTDGKPADRSDYGCAYVRKQYDDAGRFVGEAYLGADGRPVIRRDCGYASYKCIYEAGRIEEKRYYGLRGELVLNKEAGCAMMKWKHDEYGNVELFLCYGVDGKPVVSSKYQCAGIKSVYDDKGNNTELWYLDFDGRLMNRGDYGCAKICQEYDGVGNVIKAFYFDAGGEPVIRKDCGYASFENIYDAKTGRWSGSRYYDTDNRKLALRKDYGYAIIELEYDSYGRDKVYTYKGTDEQPIVSAYYHCAGMEYFYDEKGNRTKIQYLSPGGGLMTRVDFGYAQVVQRYSGSGRLTGEEYLDLKGQPAVRKEYGYASYEDVFAGNGTLLESRYYGLGGSLVLREDMGYAVVRYSYDEYGRTASKDFYGVEKEPVISTEYDCARIEFSYENGNQTEIRYYGLDGRLINRSDYGCAQLCKEYDDFGAVVKEAYFDADGQRVKRRDLGYAGCEKKYDSYHRWVETRYYDEKDCLMLNRETGIAVLKLDYDAYGRDGQYTYWGTDEQPVLNTKYFCYGMRYAYDELGNRMEIQYLGPDGEMMLRSDFGCTQVKEEYNSLGQLTKESYCDADGNPVIRLDYGYAVCTYTYENGRKKETQYLDTEEKPIARTDTGYARIQYAYNELGQLISEAYCGADGKPVISKEDKCAMYQYNYDERGNRTYIWYCGLDGSYIVHKDYGAMLNYRIYDRYDRITWDAYFNYDNSEYQRVVRKDVGYFAIQHAYDEQGRKKWKQYLDVDKNLVMYKKNGYAECRWFYNEMGQLEYERYYDAKGELVNIQRGFAEIEYIYDASGNAVDWKYRDSSGNDVR